MPANDTLLGALQGYVAFMQQQGPQTVVLPPATADGQALTAALAGLSDVARRGSPQVIEAPQPEVRTICYGIFVVGIDGLFDKVYRFTSQRSRFIVNREGQMNSDLYTFSPDERNTGLFDEFLLTATKEVYRSTSAYCRRLPFNGILYNEHLDGLPNGITTEGNILFFVEDTDKYSKEALQHIWLDVSDALYYHVLSSWYAMCRLEEARLYGLQYVDATGSLRIRLDGVHERPTKG